MCPTFGDNKKTTMKCFIIITIIAFLWNSVFGSTTKVATASSDPPALTFQCDAEGHIINVSGVDKKKLVWENNNKYCHLSAENCTDWKKQKKIHIFYDDNEVNSIIIAARNIHFYELECKDEFDVSGIATAVSVGSISTKTPISHQENTPTPPTITLSILKDSQKLSSSVLVGELLELQIIVDTKYKLDPKICSASDGKTQTEFILWNSSNCTSNDIAIMDHKWNLTMNSSKASIPFYAFKFVDSDTVVISCTAHVYPVSNSYTQVCPKNGRKRRSGNIETRLMSNVKDESATASFTIGHVTNDSNHSEGLSISLMFYMSALGASIAMMRCV